MDSRRALLTEFDVGDQGNGTVDPGVEVFAFTFG
jgi:hypothetical protein